MASFFDERRPHNGLTYDAYRSDWKARADAPLADKDKEARKMAHYLRYNWSRQQHVHDAYQPSDALRNVLDALETPQVWMVLTEPWCGDSAFVLPVIAEAASCSDDVTLRILPRDENLDIMDQYLTGGSRSIPKLVVFTEDGNELFDWGPRPEPAAEYYARLKEEKDSKDAIVQSLIAHYEDGGWHAVETELVEALRTHSEMPA